MKNPFHKQNQQSNPKHKQPTTIGAIDFSEHNRATAQVGKALNAILHWRKRGNMSAIREAIFKRVQSRLFNHLKTLQVFSDYKSSDLWKLSVEITENNSNAINRFLDEKKYTLSQTDTAIESVLKEVLIPEIDKLRI
jgi:hypothetical protein